MTVQERPAHIVRGGNEATNGNGVNRGPGGGYSGAIKYRFRDYRKFAVPSSILPNYVAPPIVIDPQGHILDGNTAALWRIDEIVDVDPLIDIASLGPYPLTAFGNPIIQPGKILRARINAGFQYQGGAVDFFEGPGDANFGSVLNGDWTIEMWINPANPAVNGGGVLFIYNGLQFTFVQADTIMAEFTFNSTTNKINLQAWQNIGSAVSADSVGTIVPGDWSHVALSRTAEGGNLFTYKMYINGILDSTQVNVPGFDYAVTGAGQYIGLGNYTDIIGFGVGSGPFNGLIDDTRISSIARSDAEILESYNRGMAI